MIRRPRRRLRPRGLPAAGVTGTVGRGWRPAVRELLDGLRALDPDVVVWRVEAGPRLDVRFVVAPAVRDEAHALLAKARAATDDVCERCGDAGRIRAIVESAVVRCDGCTER